ncbi:hypothetical protein [Streptomyces sp. NPDC088923]|uniref:hypothetical protein n=1 Tax=Streptomyces sp. NPDC088923 TaxID=3365913 RepID=UPI0038155B09
MAALRQLGTYSLRLLGRPAEGFACWLATNVSPLGAEFTVCVETQAEGRMAEVLHDDEGPWGSVLIAAVFARGSSSGTLLLPLEISTPRAHYGHFIGSGTLLDPQQEWLLQVYLPALKVTYRAWLTEEGDGNSLLRYRRTPEILHAGPGPTIWHGGVIQSGAGLFCVSGLRAQGDAAPEWRDMDTPLSSSFRRSGVMLDGEFDRQFLDELDGSLVALTTPDTGATEMRISAEVADRTFTVSV